MRQSVKVQGEYRFERIEPHYHRVIKGGAHVGYIQRDDYGLWQTIKVHGNVSENVGTKGPKMIETAIRSL